MCAHNSEHLITAPQRRGEALWTTKRRRTRRIRRIADALHTYGGCTDALHCAAHHGDPPHHHDLPPCLARSQDCAQLRMPQRQMQLTQHQQPCAHACQQQHAHAPQYTCRAHMAGTTHNLPFNPVPALMKVVLTGSDYYYTAIIARLQQGPQVYHCLGSSPATD